MRVDLVELLVETGHHLVHAIEGRAERRDLPLNRRDGASEGCELTGVGKGFERGRELDQAALDGLHARAQGADAGVAPLQVADALGGNGAGGFEAAHAHEEADAGGDDGADHAARDPGFEIAHPAATPPSRERRFSICRAPNHQSIAAVKR